MNNRQNYLQKGNYKINTQEILSQSPKGHLFKCTRLGDDEQLCVQIISKTPNYVNWGNQYKVLETLKNSSQKSINVLRIFDIIEDESMYFIFTELCDSNLEQLFQQRLSETWFEKEEINDYVGQIVRGYQYLRKLKIILRDLSPKSILVKRLANNRIVLKISDFGVSRITEDGYAETRTGIPLYSAPEVYNRSSNQQRYNDSCDIYSLGVILYMMCFKGEKPGKINNFDDLKEFHQKLQLQNFKCPNTLNTLKDICSLIEKMIVYNPQLRVQWDTLDLNFSPKFEILNDKYFVDLYNLIGQGAQGVINLAFDLKNKEELVCKTIQNKNQATQREIQNLEQIKQKYHENIIKVIDIIRQTDYTYIIMEKYGDNLQTFLDRRQILGNPLKSKEIVDIVFQIVEGYCFLKKIGIIHRDLKPANILLNNKIQEKYLIKIIDFGVGKLIGKDMAVTDAGTPIYSAPEVLQQGKPYDYQCDIYSLGVIMYQMAFLKMFKDFQSQKQLIEFHKSLENVPFNCPKHENPLITEIINKTIVLNPQKRMTWEQLQAHQIFDEVRQNKNSNQNKQALQHEYITSQPPKNYSHQQQQQQQQQLNQQQQQIKTIQKQQINPNALQPQMEIYQYIFSLQALAYKIFITFEEFQQIDQTLYDEILLLNQFLIRFSISCLKCIDFISQEGFIVINQQNFTTRQQLNQIKEWLVQINFSQLMQQNTENYRVIKQRQTKSSNQLIASGYKIFEELTKFYQTNNQIMDFLVIHQYFNKFYETVRLPILKSNIPIKARFWIEKFSNIFQEFPINQYLNYTESKITQKILINEAMDSYIRNQIDKY